MFYWDMLRWKHYWAVTNCNTALVTNVRFDPLFKKWSAKRYLSYFRKKNREGTSGKVLTIIYTKHLFVGIVTYHDQSLTNQLVVILGAIQQAYYANFLNKQNSLTSFSVQLISLFTTVNFPVIHVIGYY